jgi:LCP family protein required for cell wall assembly
VNLVLIMAALATAGGLAYVYTRSTEIQRVELGNVLTDEPVVAGEPQNYLIIGVDNAAPGEPGFRPELGASMRSDTIIVLRIDPQSEQAALLSFPRDLYVRIPDAGRDRINAAVQFGGPERLIATIEQNYEIPIHHYLSVNLDGFKQLVELLDGIPVYFPEPARDDRSGLDVPQPGCVVLDPEQALAYARARAFEVFRDGRWRVDGSGDLGRIARQQHFIRRALETAIARGARNPLVLRHLLEAGVGSVQLDQALTVEDLVDLSGRFRSFNPETLVMYSLPVVDDVVGGSDVLRLVESEAQPVFDVFRGAEAALLPSGVQLAVLNGTGAAGRAGQAAAELQAVGFVVPPGASADAERFDFARTVVRFEPGYEAQAALLQSYIAAPVDLEPVADLDAAPVVVVVGGDWAGVLQQPREASPVPAAPTTTGVEPSPETPGETPAVPVGDC